MKTHDLIKLNINATLALKEFMPPQIFKDLAKEIENVGVEELYCIITESWKKKIEGQSEKYSKHLYLRGFSTPDYSNLFLRYPDQVFDKSFETLDINEINNDSTQLFEIISMFLTIFSNMLNEPLD